MCVCVYVCVCVCVRVWDYIAHWDKERGSLVVIITNTEINIVYEYMISIYITINIEY